jgi:hypothetical protein
MQIFNYIIKELYKISSSVKINTVYLLGSFMKMTIHQITLIFTIFLTQIIFGDVPDITPEERGENLTLTVISKKGLTLMEKPFNNSRVLARIPFKSTVFLIDATANYETIIGKQKGRLVAVVWKNYEGWVFSEYLKAKDGVKFTFRSEWGIILAWRFAHGQQAKIMISEYDPRESIKNEGNILSYVLMSPPCTEIKVILQGVRKQLKFKSGKKLLFDILLTIMTSKGCEEGTGLNKFTIYGKFLGLID